MKYVLNYRNYLLENYRYVSEIKQENVPIIIQEIMEKLIPNFNISEDDISFIGSAGKLKMGTISYNINLAISEKALLENNEDISMENPLMHIKSIAENLGYNCVISNKKLLLDWPMTQRKLKGVVEVRIQTTPNLEWLKFARYSPNLNEGSGLIGKYREVLMKSIVESIQKKIISYSDNKGNVSEYKKYIFDIDEGMFSIIKTFSGNHGNLKSAKVNEDSKRLVTNDPSRFTKLLFGDSVEPKDVMTFERMLEKVKCDDFPYKRKREQIMERFKIHCKKKNLALPEKI